MSENRKGPSGATPATDKPKMIKLSCNPELFNRVFDVAMSRGRGIAMTTAARKLIRMGIKEWELNQLAGRTTKKAIEADYNRRLAEAQAMRAQIESRKRGKGKQATTQALTPLLYGIGDDE